MYDLNLSVPNITTSKYSDDDKFKLLKNYLFELNETLSYALGNIDASNFSQNIKININALEKTENNYKEIKEDLVEKFNLLKSKIINTSEEIFQDYSTAIEKTEKEILLTAEGKFLAQSEFGEYKNEATSAIKENAEGIKLNSDNIETVTADLENYKNENKAEISVNSSSIISQVENIFAKKSEFEEVIENISSQITQSAENVTENFISKISTVEEDVSTLGGTVSELVYSIDAYIKRGELETGVYGIEIGRSDSNIKARFTNEKLSFIQGSTEVAYISGNNLYILRAEIIDYFKLGSSENGYFVFDVTNNGLEVRWLNGG